MQLTPRQLLLQKLCDRLEAGFNRHVSPNDKLDRFPSIQYVIIIVATHFKMREYVAQDPVIASTTVADLADKISDLQQLPADRLF